jgi:hypothetical protein
MAKKEIAYYPNSGLVEYKLNRKHEIGERTECLYGRSYLYYVRNSFSSDAYENHFKLYKFEIVKETACFYFLINKRRVKKGSDGPYCITPEAALRQALRRADTYLTILMDKARSVNEFIQRANNANTSTALKDMRGFEAFVRSLEPEAEIPQEAYQKLITTAGGVF